MIAGLDHLQLSMPTGQEAQARAFYGELLGLEEVPKPPILAARGGVWFVLADGRGLHLGVEEGFQPARKAHPAFAVEGLDALAGLLAAAGHPVTWDQAIPEVRRFYSQDPFGNRLEFQASMRP